MIKNNTYFKLASFISIVGSGIIWTGLGYTLSILHQDSRYMGLLQLLSIITALIGPYLAIFIRRMLSLKKILIGSDICCSVLYLITFFIVLLNLTNNSLLFILFATLSMLLLAIQSVYFEPIYGKLVEKNSENVDLTSQFSKLGSYTTLGKLFGMSSGPIIFQFFQFNAFFINSITFLISGVLLFLSLRNSNIDDADNETTKKISLDRNQIKELFKNPIFLENIIASSLIFIVVLILSMKLIEIGASAFEISLYWFGATSCALLSQLILSTKTPFNFLLRKVDSRWGYLICLVPLLALLISNVYLIILFQLTFSFLNPIARNSARAKFYDFFSREKNIINAYGLRDLGSQSIILLFSLAVPFFYYGAVYILLCFFIPLLVLLRWILSRIPIPEKVVVKSED